jgi:peptide/nickel transport system ATP-binding protein
MAGLLDVENLTVRYNSEGRKAVAVDGADLKIGEKKLIAVVGESGCGKSTLALSIIGLLPPGRSEIASGSIRFKDVDLVPLAETARREYRGTEIAMIFQEPLTSLNPVYRVGDQVAEAISVRKARKDHRAGVSSDVMQKSHDARRGRPPRFRLRRTMSKDLYDEVINALRLVRMPDPEQVVQRYPFELSGGMRQRAMIAMALAEKPALLVADEPTTALDVTTQAQVLRLMKELMTEVNASILLITHDLAVANQVADEVMVMYSGSMVEDAGVDDLFNDPLHPYTKGLLACIPTGSKESARLKPIPGQLPDNTIEIVGCKFVSRCPFAMDVCSKEKPRLREVKKNHRVACYLYDKRD